MREEDEWKPAPAWQSLAADPTQKLAAIKLYRAEHNVGMGEAKAAIEAYLTTIAKT